MTVDKAPPELQAMREGYESKWPVNAEGDQTNPYYRSNKEKYLATYWEMGRQIGLLEFGP